MEPMTGHRGVGSAAKIGACLFGVWGVLHLWVGIEGVYQYLTSGTHGMWNFLIGGSHAPRAAFQHATDAVTAHAQEQLLLNFCIDVGGYGVLALVVAWLIWARASWLGYGMGLFILGICNLVFMLTLVSPGIIEPNLATLSSPALWLLAVVTTPFGLCRPSAIPASMAAASSVAAASSRRKHMEIMLEQ